MQTISILTTLLDPVEYPAEEIGQLYRQRWRGELFLDDIKTTLGLDVLRCQSPAMVAKELIVGFLAHNSIRLHRAQAAKCLEIPLQEISFQHAMNVLDAFRHLDDTPENMALRIAAIAHARVGPRPPTGTNRER